ncbi:hypothetical protein BJV78DRAFT_1217671 [Lactifluus subvellereus]|nr:hypothetical protein BJV78DRAFT_1217671 [Lactifluus subvellereus]
MSLACWIRRVVELELISLAAWGHTSAGSLNARISFSGMSVTRFLMPPCSGTSLPMCSPYTAALYSLPPAAVSGVVLFHGLQASVTAYTIIQPEGRSMIPGLFHNCLVHHTST